MNCTLEVKIAMKVALMRIREDIYNGREVISIIRSFRSVCPLPLRAHLYTAGDKKFGSGLKFLLLYLLHV
jgi:hypothetical protein